MPSQAEAANLLNALHDVQPAEAAASGDPGTSLVYQFTLTNSQTTTDTFFFGLNSSSSFATVFTPTAPLELGENLSDSFVLQVDIPSGASAGDVQHIIVITSTEVLTPTYVTATTSVNMVPALPLVVPPLATGSADPGTAITYTFTLTNQSNFTDTFFFALSSSSIFPTVFTPTDPLALGQNLSDSFALQVAVPYDALAEEVEHIIVITSTAVLTPTYVTATTSVNMAPLPPVVVPPLATGNADPGTDIAYTFTITNQSNFTDTFGLAATGIFSSLLSDTTLSLGAASSDTFSLTVTVPVSATAAEIGENWIEVTPTIASAPEPITVTTVVNALYNLPALTPATAVSNGDPGAVVTYTFNLTNNSNISDTFALAATGEWFTTILPATAVLLEPYSATPISLIVTVPVTATADATGAVTLSATSENAGAVQATATTIVGLRIGLEVAPTGSTQTTYPNQTVAYTHTITNTGNAPDTITISYLNSTPGFSSQLNTTSVTLAAGDQTTLLLSVTAPATAQHDTVNTTTLTISSGNDNSLTIQLLDVTVVQHAFIYLPFLQSPARWQPVDNTPEAITLSIDVCPSDSNLVFAGTTNGLYEGLDFVLVDDLPTGASVTGVILSQNCQEVYVSIYNQGVWKGSHSGSDWLWSQLTGGTDVGRSRALLLANDSTPVAGGDFGLAHWTGSSWQSISTINGVVMEMAISDPATNSGKMYAVVWFQEVVWTADAANPSVWSQIAGPSDPRVISVGGNSDASQIFVGTQDGVYGRIGNSWQKISNDPAYSFWQEGNQSYIGFGKNQGVWQGSIGGGFTPINNGLSPLPLVVYQMLHITHDGETWLYAATSTGVWRYGLLTD